MTKTTDERGYRGPALWFRLSPELHERLRQVSFHKRVHMAEIARAGLLREIERLEKKIGESHE